MKVLVNFLLLFFPLYAMGFNASAGSTYASLYSSTRAQLQQYYQRTDFSDPGHTTGWYRVDNFLSWLQRNETVLSQELNTLNLPLQYPQALWSYLGARYVADIYQVNPDFTRLHIQPCAKHEMPRARMEDTTLVFDPSSHHAIPAAITLGIHEGTHILPALLSDPQATSLSELASFFSQHEYGLPVKVEDATLFSYGVRDIRLTSYRKGFALVPLTYEYMLHVVGLVLLPEISSDELLTSYNDLSNSSDFNLATGIVYWHTLSQRQLFVEKQPYTEDLYLKRLLGALSANSVLYAKTHEFLTTLDRALPQEVQQQIETCFPITDIQSPCVKTVQNFMHQNPRMLIEAVKQALEEVGAPVPPTVPPGYL